MTHSFAGLHYYPVNNNSCAVDADSGVVLADDASEYLFFFAIV
jgi:hypothetical protein